MSSKNGFDSRKKGIGKLKPIPLSQLIDQWEPKDWIVDLFGAKGSSVLLAALIQYIS